MKTLAEQILGHLAQPAYKPVKAVLLAKQLRVPKKRLPEFRDTLVELLDTGRVRSNKNGRLRLPAAAGEIAGIMKRIANGGGFVIPHEKVDDSLRESKRSARGASSPPQDVFIAPQDVRDAHTGDEVLVRLTSRRRTGGQRCGEVVAVIQRATNTFVGTYFETAGVGYVLVDGGTFADPILVGDPGAKGARPKDKVVVEMLRFPTLYQRGEAVLTEVLGATGTPGVDVLSIVHEFGLPTDFPPEVLEEAREQAALFDPDHLGDRLDLTKEVTVTIDPVDARDFDDAITLKKSRNGHWQLGVHIADVAHFVPQGSALDAEARLRGTSVYLPGRVIPMLPELVSNGLASLQQGQVRYTKSVFIEYSADGVPVDVQFANSAIKVNRRFAYEEVLPIIVDDSHRESDSSTRGASSPQKGRIGAKVRQMLAWMHELAMILRRRRFEHGALELHLPEVKIDFDDEGRVTGAHEVAHDESHQIIEEFMLAANVAIATALDDKELPFLRRVHGDPDLEKLKAFGQFATALGYPIAQVQSRSHLQEIVNRVRGEPAEHAINYALLRSMKQAEYSEAELGHYALAEENYCHFTSPIRRYPDLTVHRLLDEVILRQGRPRHRNLTDLAKLGRLCSDRERRAAAAERELIKVKLLAFLESQIGETLDAVVTGVERFGIFCRGVEIPAEGLVHITALEPADFYDFEAGTFSLVGRRSGQQYRLGDKVRVIVAHVDVDRRQLDFRLVAAAPPKRKRRGK